MFSFPKKGLNISGFVLKFPNSSEFFGLNKEAVVDNEEELLKIIFSELKADSIKLDEENKQRLLDSIYDSWKKLQYPNGNKTILYDFFEKLDNAKKNKVRIIHFGDSQIEADRITSYIRNELQKKFGGNGAGLFSVEQVTRKMSVKQKHSENWERYAGFGRKKDTAVKHSKYGVLLAFSKFSPIKAPDSSIVYDSWISIDKPTSSYSKTKSYHQLKLFYGNSKHKTKVDLLVNGAFIESDSLLSGERIKLKEYQFSSTPNNIKLNFSGMESPDVYGLSIEGNKGVVMDNIPLRGASGTEFSKQDKEALKEMFSFLKPDLLILEFGGNTVPYMKTKERCFKYGSWFESQVKTLKKMNPNAAILVIGPGDMSKKENTQFNTYPLLPEVRNALKEATFNVGGVFWDMYEAMGGKNTMPKWAALDPPLASKDFIHFTSKGSKKIAELFYKTLEEDYNQYKETIEK